MTTRNMCFRLVASALLVAVASGPLLAAEVGLPRFPSVSPDGREVVFSWRGDLWKVGVGGGVALRLTAHPADELGSAWSPDGDWIAFESDRTGRRNIHAMRADGSEVRQVTFEDGTVSLSGFSADGSRVLVSASVEGDTYRSPRPYSAPFEGGPLTRLHDAFGDAPVASADGERYAFTRGSVGWNRRHYRGADNKDLFVYDRRDGSFQRLTSWSGTDGEARWRDDRTIVFMSDRGDGEQNTIELWSMRADRGEADAVRLTEGDRDINSFDVSRDGRTVVFNRWDGLYAARFGGRRLGEPERIEIVAPADAFPRREMKDISSEVNEAVLSPDGKVMAYVAFGDVFVRAVAEGSPTRRVTEGMSREREVAWSPDMSRLYFVSDSGGENSIYASTVSVTRGELVDRFEERTAVRVPETEIPNLAVESADQPVEPAEPDQSGEPGKGAGDEPGPDKSGAEPDAASEAKGGDEPEDAKDKTPKVADRWRDAVRFGIEPIVVGVADDRSPSPSPDGLTLAFRRGLGDLVLRDLRTGDERVLNESWDFRTEMRWSPDGSHIAYSVSDSDFNADIWIAPADGSWDAVNITRHPDNESSPRWSADGKMLAFLSEREGDEDDVYLVMLDRVMEAKTALEREAYFKDRNAAVKKRGVIDPISWDSPTVQSGEANAEAVEPEGAEPGAEAAEPPFTPEDLGDAYRRLRRITSYPGGESNLEMTPSGERLVFRATGGAGGTTGAYSVKWDGSDEKRLSTGGVVQQVSMDGSKVVLISAGRASTVAPTGGSDERLDISGTTELDHRALSLQKFNEMAGVLGRTFYHPTMKGLDWDALTAEYAGLASNAYTSNEFVEVGRRLMGELSASHLGVTASADYTNPDFRASGRLGIDATPVDGGFRVDHVLPRSTTNAGVMRLRVGDVITAIELEPIRPGQTLDQRLIGRAGEETIVTVERTLDGKGPDGGDTGTVSLDLLVTPVSSGAERLLRYDDWQLSNAKKVEELSGGRLGYLHIRSMGGPDLVEYERDLYAAAAGKEGLLIDVRSNGGGWTTDLVLASLMYPEHAYTIPRGADPEKGKGYPRDRLYIQRFTGPVNMLCNEKSFSNAEIISHAFKTLGRGTLVGQETHGSVISTGAFTLVDGTRVRQPFRGWYLPDGTDMENNGAVPDIVVEQMPEDEAAGLDRQLGAAVEDLLKRLD